MIRQRAILVDAETMSWMCVAMQGVRPIVMAPFRNKASALDCAEDRHSDKIYKAFKFEKVAYDKLISDISKWLRKQSDVKAENIEETARAIHIKLCTELLGTPAEEYATQHIEAEFLVPA